MPWKNSSVIKNSFIPKCLLATLSIPTQINKLRLLVRARGSESASVPNLGHNYLTSLHRKPLSHPQEDSGPLMSRPQRN